MKNIGHEEIKYKLIVIGDENVGKTSIINRFKSNQFTGDYQPTVGLDFQNLPLLIDNQNVNLLLYDTAGQEKFRSLIPMYTRDANIVLLVYDITCKDSFMHVSDWLKDLTNLKKEEVIFALVGNKIDIMEKREVTLEEGQKFAEDQGFIFQEVSAKSGDGFSDLFYKSLFERIRVKFRPGGQQPTTEVKDIKFNIEQEAKKSENKRKCC